jgi:two-component system, NarL family, sensor histidine kinase UhpB
MRVLIVDDSKIERMILKDLLESEGHAVESTENGEQALQSAFVCLPDLIISDILMPVVDGFSLCKSIRSDPRTAYIPFVFYTATYTKTDDEALGLKMGADGFFRKPMEWDEFYTAVSALVRDIEKSGRLPEKIPDEEEGDLYKLYNERLIKKLEDKVFELEKEVRWRKKIEAQLRDSQQRLDLAIEGANIGMWDWNVETGAAYITPKWVENFGYKIEEITQHIDSWVNMIHPDDKQNAWNAVAANLNGNTRFYENEHRLKDAVDGWRWVLSRGKVVDKSPNGKPLRQSGIFMEITERKKAEEELQKSREALRDLSKYLQTAIENERIKIAQEIHDDLGQVLTAVKMDSFWLIDKIPKTMTDVIEKAKSVPNMIDKAILSIKRIVSDLRPGLLDDLGFAAAIEWQAGEYQRRSGVAHHVQIIPEDLRLDADLSTALFRICQEALTNAAKHANASQILIKIILKNGFLDLSVMDNGIGIDETKISDSQSFGLMGMRERAASFGGSMDITRIHVGGTKVAVKMPVKKCLP